jgi:glycosyltransferase involved in cell wall biosynthesis
MSKEIKISVVIPVFNRAHTIKRCLESILQQTKQVFEIIIVDDCSSDNLNEILLNFPSEKIRLLKHDENKGSQAARNTGVKAAFGNWIAFQDSDDEWLPTKIEKQVAQLQKTGIDEYTIVHTNAFKQTSNGREEYILPKTEGQVYLDLLKRPSPVFPSILASKKALETIQYLDEDIPTHQEWDTCIRLAKYCYFIHITEPLVIWHIQENEESISRSLTNRIVGYEFVFQKHLSEIQQQKEANEIIFYHWHNLYLLADGIGLEKEQNRFFFELRKYNKREVVLIYLSRILGLKYSTNPPKLILKIVEFIYRIRNKYENSSFSK